MARVRTAARLHLLTTKQVQNAADGDHSDGRIRGGSCSWVFRFTAPTGRRREMGLGVAHRDSAAQAGESFTGARRQAQEAREQLLQGVEPIDAREQRREAAHQAEQAKKAHKERERWTLARPARDYHERVMEPSRTTKHAAQWIASLEHHVPPAIWNKPIADVEPPELLAALSSVRRLEDKDRRIPETLQRVRQRLDAVFEDAIFHKRCTSNAANPILFDDYSKHPQQRQSITLRGAIIRSDAAGRYQFMGRYWPHYKLQLNLPDFGPESQDRWAVQLMKECRVLDDVETGHLTRAVARCASRWASFEARGTASRRSAWTPWRLPTRRPEGRSHDPLASHHRCRRRRHDVVPGLPRLQETAAGHRLRACRPRARPPPKPRPPATASCSARQRSATPSPAKCGRNGLSPP